jgi:hypothetical protein
MKSLLIAIVVGIAAFAASQFPAHSQQPGSFCLQGPEGTPMRCDYTTMAACQEALKGESRTSTCIPNPKKN